MRLPYQLPARYALGVAATAMIGLTACGSGGHRSGSGAPSTSGCSATGTGSNQATVCETEYHISLSSTTFTAGGWTFVADNNGRIEHSLAIKGPGVNATSPLLSPGQSANLQVTLQDGTYELWCPVPGHKALGMDTHITVNG
jgi:hypothetical protein